VSDEKEAERVVRQAVEERRVVYEHSSRKPLKLRSEPLKKLRRKLSDGCWRKSRRGV
jgi:hypothetical protein